MYAFVGFVFDRGLYICFRSGVDVVPAHDLNVKSDAFRHFLLASKLCTEEKKNT